MGSVHREHDTEAGVRDDHGGDRVVHPLPYADPSPTLPIRPGRPHTNFVTDGRRPSPLISLSLTPPSPSAPSAGSPSARSAVTGLGAGVGVGMGYTDCKHEFLVVNGKEATAKEEPKP